MLYQMTDFFISQWIWSLTWGIYQLPLSCLFMFFLLKWIEHLKFIRSLLTSILVHAITLFVVWLIMMTITFCIEYVPNMEKLGPCISVLYSCLYLASIYVLIQAIFFMLFARVLRITWCHAVLFSIVSNICAAVVLYKVLPCI